MKSSVIGELAIFILFLVFVYVTLKEQRWNFINNMQGRAKYTRQNCAGKGLNFKYV